ncbi:MAG: Rieske (2Fe-2S) protein [Anaerolineales bacterium]|jgi:nitrite reductase/ring-hydroxylating ferredoxin subunit
MTQKLSRRSFIKLTGAAGTAFLLSSCNIKDSILGTPETQLPIIEGAWSYTNGTLSLDLSKLPELDELGGAVRIEGAVLPDPILVVLGEDGDYYAFKNACTHGGRMIDPVAGTMTLQCCSLSRSTYDYQGSVISGPAPSPLTSYPLAVEGEQLLITL